MSTRKFRTTGRSRTEDETNGNESWFLCRQMVEIGKSFNRASVEREEEERGGVLGAATLAEEGLAQRYRCHGVCLTARRARESEGENCKFPRISAVKHAMLVGVGLVCCLSGSLGTPYSTCAYQVPDPDISQTTGSCEVTAVHAAVGTILACF